MITGVKGRSGSEWLAGVFYPMAVVLMETFWVYPWLVWLGNWPVFDDARPVLSLASVVFTLAAGLLVTRLAIKPARSLWRARVVIIGAGLLAILVVLGLDYRADYALFSGQWFIFFGRALATTFSSPGTIAAAVPALLYLWWRGIVLGQTTSYFRDIYRTFILGMVALVILIILWQISAASGRFPSPGTEIGLYVMAFFFFGLTAIAVSHIFLMRSSMPREEAALTSVWRWLPVMLGVIGGMVLVGFGLASIFSPDLFETIGRGFSAIGDFLGKILGYILAPVFFAIEWLFRFVRYLLSLLRSDQPPMEGTGNVTSPLFPDVTPRELAPWVETVIKWTAIALIAGAVLFVLAKAISRDRRQRAREQIEEVHESLFSWKGLRDDLKELLGLVGKRFQRKPAAPGFHFDAEAAGRLDIREIYRHVLWEGARSGISRRPYETAKQYSLRLMTKVPESVRPLDDITGLYENVRYGDISAPEERIDTANGWWEKLRSIIRKSRGVE